MRWRLVSVVLMALLGYGVGWLSRGVGDFFASSSSFPFLKVRVPLPHHVSKDPGGVALRFAMAHDVLHERFPKHGPAHYQERNRLTRAALAKLPPNDPARDPLDDDLGAGLERLGQTDEAIATLRTKLARQQARGVSGRDLYTSYANLGTFLIHGNFKKAMNGDLAAKRAFQEGVGFIRKSVEVNPEAHFGRERWQAAIAEFLLAAIDNPKLLTTFDCIGNRLDLDVPAIISKEWDRPNISYGEAFTPRFSQADPVAKREQLLKAINDPGTTAEQRALLRQEITKVGVETDWKDVPVPSHRSNAPFDEPVLGMIGMWRQGGGANPIFALAMGETMLRVGQRYIAWSAFERAGRMAERYWPDPSIQKTIRDHCAKRQADIEKTRGFELFAPARPLPGQPNSPPTVSPAAPIDLRTQFENELDYGQRFQAEYQAYETALIKTGRSIEDEHFFDDFYANRPPIASPSGPEEWYTSPNHSSRIAYLEKRAIASGLLGAGISSMSLALVFRLFDRWSRSRSSNRTRRIDPMNNLDD